MQDVTFTITSLGDCRYRLKKPITITLSQDDDEEIYEIKALGTWAMSSSKIGAIAELKEEVIILYNEIAMLKDIMLGTRCQQRKQFLLDHVEKVDYAKSNSD